MRAIALAVALSVAAVAVGRAQTADPQVQLYEQLLTEANRRVVQVGAQVQALQAENAKLKADLAKAKEGEKKD